jgi:hypothetical protein
MIAITGCARAGTAYTATLLHHFGYEVGHEELLPDGIVSWPIAAATIESPWGPSPAKILTIADVVLHQVREPLSAIRSVLTLADSSWDFICATTPCKKDDPLLMRAAKYWLHWNLMSENVASRTYRLESIRDEVPALIAALGRPPVRTDVDSVPRANARPSVGPPVTWDALRTASTTLADEIAALAVRYGYPAGESAPR